MAFSYRQAKMLPSDDLTTFYKAFLYRPAVSIFKTYKTAKLINPVAPEQKNVPYYISGNVLENITPVNRVVNIHRRDSGELIKSVESDGDGGYFYATTTYSGSHYVVCIDDAAGLDYNDLIYGNIFPTTVSG